MRHTPAAVSLTIGCLSTYRVGVELRPPSYFALAALIDGPLHGYAIAQRARELGRTVGPSLNWNALRAAGTRALRVAGDCRRAVHGGWTPSPRLHPDAGRQGAAG